MAERTGHRRNRRKLARVSGTVALCPDPKGESVVNVDLVIPAGSNQATRHLLGVATPVRKRDGSRSGAVSVMNDITAHRYNGEDSYNLSAMSRELRAPLSAILGFSHFPAGSVAIAGARFGSRFN